MSNRYYGQRITREQEFELGLRGKCWECGCEADSTELTEVMGDTYCRGCLDDMDRGEECKGCGVETHGMMNKIIPCCDECFESGKVVDTRNAA